MRLIRYAALIAPLPASADGENMLEGALSLIRLGGPVVVVLLVMSVIALAVSAFKTLQVRSLERGAREADSALDAWCRGEGEAAVEALVGTRSALVSIVADGMRWLRDGRAEERVREELVRRAEQLAGEAASLLGLLEQVAYLAPLLGLLGTVLGIIDVFQGLALQGAQADAGSLAGGIWEALLTTAVGLCVAIPFAMVHALLENRIERFRHQTEDRLTRLFTGSLYLPR